MKAAGDCCVILREERPKDLKVTGMLSFIVVRATRDNDMQVITIDHRP